MRRRRRIWLIVVLLVALVCAVIVLLLITRSRNASDAVSGDDAAKLVRAPSNTHVAAGLRPAAGTYTYVGGGSENISILGGSKHVFPETFSAVVSLDAQRSCIWSLDLVMLRQHLEHRTFCTTRAGVSDEGFSRTTNFLTHEQTSTYACSRPALRWKATARPHDAWKFTCTEARGAHVNFTVRHEGDETLTIDGSPVTAHHVSLVATQRDAGTGDEHSEYWLADSGLIIRMRVVRSLDAAPQPVIGQMKLRERYDYQLASLTPEARR